MSANRLNSEGERGADCGHQLSRKEKESLWRSLHFYVRGKSKVVVFYVVCRSGAYVFIQMYG